MRQTRALSDCWCFTSKNTGCIWSWYAHIFSINAVDCLFFFPAEARLVSCLRAWEWGCYNTVVTFMPAVGNMVHVYPIDLLNYRVACTCGQKRRVSWRQLGVQMSVSTERGSVSTTEPEANLPWVVRSSCPLALSSSPQQTPCWSSSSQTCEEGAWSGQEHTVTDLTMYQCCKLDSETRCRGDVSLLGTVGVPTIKLHVLCIHTYL